VSAGLVLYVLVLAGLSLYVLVLAGLSLYNLVSKIWIRLIYVLKIPMLILLIFDFDFVDQMQIVNVRP